MGHGDRHVLHEYVCLLGGDAVNLSPHDAANGLAPKARGSTEVFDRDVFSHARFHERGELGIDLTEPPPLRFGFHTLIVYHKAAINVCRSRAGVFTRLFAL